MTEKTQIASDAKKVVVKSFSDLIKEYKVIASVDVENLPAKQLNNMRAQLRGKAVLLMTKRRLLNKALETSDKKDIQKLSPYLKGMPALLFSNENPFSLFKTLKKSKSPAPIKAGQEAPKDIVVKTGGTSFAPGPIIGELGMFGIKTGVENGKVAIKADSVVAKEGDTVNQKLAALLQRLNIMPMEIGLNLVAAYENGAILTKKDLNIDEEAFIRDLRSAASDAFALSVELALSNKDNIIQLLSNAHMNAFALTESESIMTSDNVSNMLAKANAQA